jgi:hypothetical protein
MVLPCTWTWDDLRLGWEFFVVSVISLLSIDAFHPASLANPSYIAAVALHMRAQRMGAARSRSRVLATGFGVVAAVSGLTWAWEALSRDDLHRIHIGYLAWEAGLLLGAAAVLAAWRPASDAPPERLP